MPARRRYAKDMLIEFPPDIGATCPTAGLSLRRSRTLDRELARALAIPTKFPSRWRGRSGEFQIERKCPPVRAFVVSAIRAASPCEPTKSTRHDTRGYSQRSPVCQCLSISPPVGFRHSRELHQSRQEIPEGVQRKEEHTLVDTSRHHRNSWTVETVKTPRARARRFARLLSVIERAYRKSDA